MKPKIAYLTSKFPSVSETFVLYEVLELIRLGARIDIFPLLKQELSVEHSEVIQLHNNVHYAKLLTPGMFRDHLYWLFRKPLLYFLAIFSSIWGNIRNLKFLKRALYICLIAPSFSRDIEKLEIDHIHAHWATHPALTAYFIHILTEIPFSFTAHANDIYASQTMLEEKIEKSSFLVTISDFNRRFLKNIYPDILDEKIKIIHCGIDPDIFQPARRIKKNPRFTISCVARLDEKKGHAYLIEACKILKEQGVEFDTYLIGDGDQRDTITEQVENLGLNENVHLLGFQAREQVVEYLNKSDVLVLPSVITADKKMEGIPVALMEALAMELPIIATDISGVPELVINGETGVLVPERDAEALSEALFRLFNDEALRAKLAQAGRQKVLAEFNLKTSTAELFALFEKQIKESRDL